MRMSLSLSPWEAAQALLQSDCGKFFTQGSKIVGRMPRKNRGIEVCKIRKRGCTSSSSSSVLPNYRFKRAILIGKRAGSSTPVPTWKMTSRSPSVVGFAESPKFPPPSQAVGKPKPASLSARKLAATLWELNEIPTPQLKVREYDVQGEKRAIKDARARERIARSVQSASLPPHLSDPSHSPVSERSETSSIRRRMPAIPHKVRTVEPRRRGFDTMSNGSLMEIETCSRGLTPKSSLLGVRCQLRDVSNGLKTSKELLKILTRVWGMEDQHSSSMSLVSALRIELERARELVEQVIQEERSDKDEINYLLTRFAEEKATWKAKEQERFQAAVQSIAADLEVERKLRRRTESINVKLSRELTDSKCSLSKTLKELESEKRARDIMEQVCDELAQGIGEDKAAVEELKKESAKVREEVEKEREMLQLADVWREERVQMKLSEAKFQFEEKNAAVDKLRNELEAFLQTKHSKEMRGYKHSSVEVEDQRQMNQLAKTTSGINFEGEDGGEVEDGGESKEDSEGSVESDLHSIELNMDNNRKGYKWTYAMEAAQADGKGDSIDREIRGRISLCEKNPKHKSISHDRSLSVGIQWDSTNNNRRVQRQVSEQGRFFEIKKEDNDIDGERYKSVKGLRDHILLASRIVSASQGFASPTREWGPHWPLQDSNSIRERTKASDLMKGMREKSLKAKGECLRSWHRQSQATRQQSMHP